MRLRTVKHGGTINRGLALDFLALQVCDSLPQLPSDIVEQIAPEREIVAISNDQLGAVDGESVSTMTFHLAKRERDGLSARIQRVVVCHVVGQVNFLAINRNDRRRAVGIPSALEIGRIVILRPASPREHGHHRNDNGQHRKTYAKRPAHMECMLLWRALFGLLVTLTCGISHRHT